MNKLHIVRLQSALAAAVIVTLVASCSPKVDNNGYVREGSIKDQITIGQSTRDDVKNKLGSPSTLSSFGDEAWYYITDRKEGYAFLKPEVVTQDVTRIQFDGNGVVAKVDSYNKDSSAEFDVATRTTPTEGHTLGFFEQLLGNIGRFNHPSNDSVAAGRKSSGGM